MKVNEKLLNKRLRRRMKMDMISYEKGKDKILNERLRRKPEWISHTKGNEKLLNKRLIRKMERMVIS